MNNKDFKGFRELWIATSESSAFKTTPSESAVNVAFDDLSRYSAKQVEDALQKFRKMRNQPLTSALIESIITGNFWLTAEEAWGLAQKTFDPTRSVVVTKEIITAASKVESMYNGGERTAAKNTFTAIYERLIMTAISEGKSPKWQVWQLEHPTRGNSAEQANRQSIIEAMDNGIITMQNAVLLGYTPKQKTLSLQVLSDNAPDENAKKQIDKLKVICHRGSDNE